MKDDREFFTILRLVLFSTKIDNDFMVKYEISGLRKQVLYHGLGHVAWAS